MPGVSSGELSHLPPSADRTDRLESREVAIAERRRSGVSGLKGVERGGVTPGCDQSYRSQHGCRKEMRAERCEGERLGVAQPVCGEPAP